MREYGLDLTVELPRMSWRRFQALLRGLSAESASVMRSLQRTEFGKKPPVKAVNTPAQAQTTFVALFGSAPPRPAR